MTKYAKIIDNRKCIGCHACSVACKEENQVPLGVFRTWVKYTEKGAFPNTRRNFQVTRCNQCENPPCVTICPVTAMYRRPDGIVEFDGDKCIGCKACLNACPYDAIYIDPESHTAAKCHFCAHRIDNGLEPACVIVCPERAIIVGDMDDPNSEVSVLLAREETTVRKSEQNTLPKLFYIEGDAATLTPGAAPLRDSHLFADTGYDDKNFTDEQSIKPFSGPIQNAGRFALNLVQTVYDVPHERPWGWKVSTYLWTKSLGAGALFLPAFLLGIGALRDIPIYSSAAALLALIFIGITTLFLVWDLKRPERFLTILFRPQWRSWLTIGAFILIAYSALGGIWFLAAVAHLDFLSPLVLLPINLIDLIRALLNFPVAVLGVLAAIYSAFLFSQAEGRDLWQSPLVLLELFLHAVIGGSGILLLLAAAFSVMPGTLTATEFARLFAYIFIGSLLAFLATKLIADFFIAPPTSNARMGHHAMVRGEFAKLYWAGIGALLLSLAVGLIAVSQSSLLLGAVAAVFAIPALWLLEHGWVQAGQAPPNS
ncbi:MAG TPA: 4Fe-4S dicluster domain-containing protein [Anaerolineae bacterium]|nr:4Fe-4S dicluster domain-containing protein [Anaerolineae bacterium]